MSCYFIIIFIISSSNGIVAIIFVIVSRSNSTSDSNVNANNVYSIINSNNNKINLIIIIIIVFDKLNFEIFSRLFLDSPPTPRGADAVTGRRVRLQPHGVHHTRSPPHSVTTALTTTPAHHRAITTNTPDTPAVLIRLLF